MKPAARKGDSHKCPKDGHDDGEISEGASSVTINDKPAARVGDKIICADGSEQIITEGSDCVFIEGKAAARLDDPSEHGGTIASGSSNVFIGTGGNTRVHIGKNVHFGNKGTIHIGGKTINSPVSASSPPIAEKVIGLNCQQAWAIEEADIKNVTSIPNPIHRNRHITSAYAKLYLKNPKLRWSGVAAFASKQVGCGLRDAERTLQQTAPNPATINSAALLPAHNANPALISLEHNYAQTAYDGLSKGNLAVFEEIYPVIQFYLKYGMAKLKGCAGERKPELKEKLLTAFEKIDRGDVAGGADDILNHEQKNTLDKAIYKNEAFAEMLRMNQLGEKIYIGRVFGTQPMALSFTAQCHGGKEIAFDGMDLADIEQRMPYAEEVAGSFQELLEQQREAMEAILKHLAQNGGDI